MVELVKMDSEVTITKERNGPVNETPDADNVEETPEEILDNNNVDTNQNNNTSNQNSDISNVYNGS